MTKTLTILLIIAAWAIPQSAWADYASQFLRGKTLYQQGHYQQALPHLERALAHDMRPGAKYYKALCLIGLKRYREAEPLLLAVKADPQTPDPVRVKITQALATIAAALEVATLQIDTGTLRGVDVTIDGAARGKTPLTLNLPRGKHQLTLKRRGYLTLQRGLELRGGETKRLALALKVAPVLILLSTGTIEGAAVTLDGEPVGVTPLRVSRKPGRYRLGITKPGYLRHRETLVVKLGEPLEREVLLSEPTLHPTRKLYRTVWASTLGAGLVGLGVGTVFQLLAKKNNDRALDSSTPQTEVDGLISKSNTQKKVAYVMYGVGGAAFVTAIVFIALDLTYKPDPDGKRAWIIVPQRQGVSLFARF